MNDEKTKSKIKKKLEQVLTDEIFDFNDYNTRNRVILNMTPFLLTLQKKGKIFDFTTHCDSFNNTPDVIDNNELRASVYIREDESCESWYCIHGTVQASAGVIFSEVRSEK